MTVRQLKAENGERVVFWVGDVAYELYVDNMGSQELIYITPLYSDMDPLQLSSHLKGFRTTMAAKKHILKGLRAFIRKLSSDLKKAELLVK